MLQGGPYLRTREGDEAAVLCNHDEILEEAGEHATSQACSAGFEVIPASYRLKSRALHRNTQEAVSTSRAPGTQEVYSCEVDVRPTKKQRISGRLSLIRQSSVLFFAWLPRFPSILQAESNAAVDKIPAVEKDMGGAPVSLGQYAVHPISVLDVKAVRKHMPRLMPHHIVLILKDGTTLPPFYFKSGGVKALFNVLKQHVVLSKGNDDPSTYLINDVEDPLSRSMATMDLPDVAMDNLSFLPPTVTPARTGKKDGEALVNTTFMESVREAINMATQITRDTTASFLLPPKQSSFQEGVEGQRVQDKAQTGVGLFEMVDRSELQTLGSGVDKPCPPPLTREEWPSFLDSAGRVVDSKALRQRIFNGGVDPRVRKEAWKYLLGMYPLGSTFASRQAMAQGLTVQYERYRSQWTSITELQAARYGKWRERRSRINKDVVRTDCSHSFYAGEGNPNVEALRRILLTYSIYNFDLGYCQGMSDLASPILYVLEDEALAFWCFDNLMQRMEANFSTDSTAMQAQLAALCGLVRLLDPELHSFLEAKDCLNFFFCYRWLLVHFKREFAFDESLQLWEALWSCPLTPNFHIYMCAAVLIMHRSAIMATDMCFDMLLGFCIQLAHKLDLGRTMRCAERLFAAAGEAGMQCLRAADLPS